MSRPVRGVDGTSGATAALYDPPFLTLRINLQPGGRIGPGKVELLEHIASFGSISAGARQMNMSYKRAWDLIDEMNRMFGTPVVSARTGGKQGGGAHLTPTGLEIVGRYRAIERAAEAAAHDHIAALVDQIKARRRGGAS